MNLGHLIERVVEKTRSGKLAWETTADPNERVATLGGQYVLRLVGPHSEYNEDGDYSYQVGAELSLETGDGQAVTGVSASATEEVPNAGRINDLWEMMRFGGRSVEEVVDDAARRLEEL